MKLKLFIAFSALFLINSLTAQSPRYIISGVIKDASTGETLPFANVFLSGTTYGTTSDQDGFFELKIFEPGTYELIVRFVGFDTYVKSVSFTMPEEIAFEVQLQPENINLGSIVVTDQLDEEWQRNLAVFKREFLGMTKNASSCKIINEEEINFYFNKEKRTLEAFIKGPIQVENKALGYRLDYYLEDFVIDYKQEYIRYFGYTQYSELKDGNDQKRRFIKAREKAYQGSKEHFFKALYENKLEEQGYEVMFAQDVKGLGRAVTAKNVNLYDSIASGPNEFTKSLGFQHYIYITYLNELEAVEYTGTAGMTVQGQPVTRKPQRSWISLIDRAEPILFEQSGYVLNPVSFHSNGYWGFEKVGDMLPSNYSSPDH
jgi:hypothetical protein